MRIERQCPFEIIYGLITVLTRRRFQSCGTASQNIILWCRMIGRPGSFSGNQFQVECNCDPARDLILHSKQIAGVAIEPSCPQMHVCFSIYKLSVDSDPTVPTAYATF